MDLFGTWLAALLTLAAFSFLYKDNPFFRFAESLFAGVSLGYYVGNVLNQTLVPNLLEPMVKDFATNWDLLVPGLMGLMLYMRGAPRIGWISRYALAINVNEPNAYWSLVNEDWSQPLIYLSSEDDGIEVLESIENGGWYPSARTPQPQIGATASRPAAR